MTISPAFVDAPAQTGLGWSIPASLEPAFVDLAVAPPGPLAIGTVTPGTFTPRVTVAVYGPAGQSLISEIENATNVRFMDELNGPGFGSFDLQLDDADITHCTAGRAVKVSLDGINVFTFRIEGRPRLRQVDPGEEAEYVMTVAGRGWAVDVDDSIIYPSRDLLTATPDLDDPFKQEWRSFNFASIDFPNGQDWPLAVERYEYSQLQGYRFQRVEVTEGTWENKPAPVGFPFPNSEIYSALATDNEKSHWITPPVSSTSIGWFFFAGILIHTSNEPVTFAMTADNLFTFWINGVPVLGEEGDHKMWEGWKEVTLPLEAGWYRLCCAVENVADTVAAGEPNHGGWLMGSFIRGADGNPKSGAITTNELWKSYYSPDIWPGWTPGQILSQIITEGIARGSLDALFTGMFSDTADSNGAPWQGLYGSTITSYIPNFSVRVGSTMLAMLEQLNEEGWVDWHILPASQSLQVWSSETGGINSGVTYTVGTNIVELDRAESKQFANALLVSWEDGYVEVEDAASIATYGRHEDIYDSGATDEDEATRMGTVELNARATAATNDAVVMTIQPVDDTETPYLAYTVNDFVTAPDADGSPTSMRVMSISCEVDDMGDPLWSLELNKRWPVRERQQIQLLRSIGGKSLGVKGAL